MDPITNLDKSMVRGTLQIGSSSVLDPFLYASANLVIGHHCHIGPSCTIGGGSKYTFTLGDYSSLSSGVRVYCESNRYCDDLIILNPEGKDIGEDPICGNVILDKMTGVGANTIIMPDNHIPTGTVVGACSFVPAHYSFDPWTVYAGCPIQPIKARNRERVLEQVRRLQL